MHILGQTLKMAIQKTILWFLRNIGHGARIWYHSYSLKSKALHMSINPKNLSSSKYNYIFLTRDWEQLKVYQALHQAQRSRQASQQTEVLTGPADTVSSWEMASLLTRTTWKAPPQTRLRSDQHFSRLGALDTYNIWNAQDWKTEITCPAKACC